MATTYVRSKHKLESVRLHRAQNDQMLYDAESTITKSGYLSRSGSIPEELSITRDGTLMYDGGPYRDGRARGRSSTRLVSLSRTRRTTDQKVLDTNDFSNVSSISFLPIIEVIG